MKPQYLMCISVFSVTVVIGLAFVDNAAGNNASGDSGVAPAIAHKSVDGDCFSPGIGIPSTWRVDVKGKECGGWRQTGIAPGCVDDVADEVDSIMLSHGFMVSRRVCGQEIGDSQKLVQYETKSGEKAMWMLWDAGANKTGFAWGKER